MVPELEDPERLVRCVDKNGKKLYWNNRAPQESLPQEAESMRAWTKALGNDDGTDASIKNKGMKSEMKDFWPE